MSGDQLTDIAVAKSMFGYRRRMMDDEAESPLIRVQRTDNVSI